jgi:hypothetical protein
MTTAKVTKAKAVKAAKKEPVEAPPDGIILMLIPAGTLRTHVVSISPTGSTWSVEAVLRMHGYAV